MTIKRIEYRLNTMLNTYKRNFENLEARTRANQMMAAEAIEDGDLEKAARYLKRLEELRTEMYELTEVLGKIEDCFEKLNKIAVA